MALTVNDIYNLMKFLIRKNATGSLSSTEFEIAWNSEQKSFQSDLLGRFQKQSNGKQGMNTGLALNQTIMTKLTPFTHNVSIPVVSGYAVKPYNFIYELGLRSTGDKQVTHVQHGQLSSVINDSIDPPSIVDGAYYTAEYDDKYKVLPQALGVVYLDYIGTPRDVVWGYGIDIYDRRQYNQNTSTQAQWMDNDIIEITKRTLKSLGVSFKDADFVNFGQSTIITGD